MRSLCLAITTTVVLFTLPAAVSTAHLPDPPQTAIRLKIVGVQRDGIVLSGPISDALIAALKAPPAVKNGPRYEAKPYLFFYRDEKVYNIFSGGITVDQHDGKWDVYAEPHIKKIAAEYERLLETREPAQCFEPLKDFCDKLAVK